MTPKTAALATPVVDKTRLNELIEMEEQFSHLRDALIERLATSGCILEGHFRLQSRQHSSIFLRFRNFAADPRNLTWLGGILATTIRQSGRRFDSIVAPDTAGSLLAFAIGEVLGKEDKVLLLQTDYDHHVTQEFVADRVRSGDRILLVNDILTTGQGVDVMMRAIRQYAGSTVGLALFSSRDKGVYVPDGGLPIYRVFRLITENYGAPGEDNQKVCPLCHKNEDDLLEASLLN